ncbi:gamma carbonic anhydrase family protein [Rickettsiella endosymbiont of Miltochrista miniata]|uniref:gamma carbonic anhydrase family protein n=1 Tax=Rickettsiella endosymbiont of Miltochrista miniata TaxID=3066239 RepID=UPI00313D73B2
MLYSFEDRHPTLLGEDIFIAESADVIGSVIIHNHVIILPHAVVRADNTVIEIGENTNIQDGAVLHTDPDMPMQVGRNVTIAHHAMVHARALGDYSVVAIGAKILNNAVIGKHCLIAANAMVLENQHIPDGSLVMGSPGKIKPLSPQQIADMQWYAQHYVEKIHRYQKGLKRFEPQLSVN